MATTSVSPPTIAKTPAIRTNLSVRASIPTPAVALVSDGTYPATQAGPAATGRHRWPSHSQRPSAEYWAGAAAAAGAGVFIGSTRSGNDSVLNWGERTLDICSVTRSVSAR